MKIVRDEVSAHTGRILGTFIRRDHDYYAVYLTVWDPQEEVVRSVLYGVTEHPHLAISVVADATPEVIEDAREYMFNLSRGLLTLHSDGMFSPEEIEAAAREFSRTVSLATFGEELYGWVIRKILPAC
jgi:hypothetical protein